jgi:holin-like protein
LLGAIFTILIFQLAGEVIQKGFELPLPGPVLGLILLLFSLVFTKKSINPNLVELRARLMTTSEKLLSYLSLLFVPIGVGVIMHLQLLEGQLLKIVFVIGLGTIMTMVFTAFIFSVFSKISSDE